jgi:hypothetical protein
MEFKLNAFRFRYTPSAMGYFLCYRKLWKAKYLYRNASIKSKFHGILNEGFAHEMEAPNLLKTTLSFLLKTRLKTSLHACAS